MDDHSDDPKECVLPPETGLAWTGVERRRWQRQSELETQRISTDSPALLPLRFSTKDLAPADQFEAWRAHMEPVIDVLLPDGISSQDGFEATHTVWNLGQMLLVQQCSDAYSYIRTPVQLRSSPIDHWYLGLRHSGHAWTEVDGKVIKTGSGNVAFRTLGHPYRGRCTQSEITLLYMPYSLFANEAGIFKTANNSILSGNLADLLVSYLSQVEAYLPSLTSDELPRIVQTIRNMIVNGIAPSVKAEQSASVQVNLGTMERIHHYIHHNLYDPQLTPDRICRVVGISRTRLYQLLEPNGGVLNYIRKQRLHSAYETLRDPKNYQRILDIAQKSGFDVAANFTRAFIHEFGLSPSEVRKRMAVSLPASTPSVVESCSPASFESWIKNLGL